ncbi:hypothetical protein D7W81_35850 [Corallococcus aberystwythensis]|uniref:Uncharacterized protein n=1 Tax=Corallococcus aberystwythensis TaxID=2316722 RepID=A0A3A8PVX3_9BACT|nr:hypothetical protein D7W81_35850 [Corallococcus aberystwythensis]
MGLLVLGLGLTHCSSKPQEPLDAGTQEPSDAGTPDQTLLQDALLMDVDVHQRFLVASAFDAGTLVQELATGITGPIAPLAQSARFTREGDLLLLQGAPKNDRVTFWVWRPGQPQARELGQHWQQLVLNEGARRYLAWSERTPEETIAVRMMPVDTCTAEACPVRTLFRIEEDTSYPIAVLFAGDRFLWVTKKERVWRVDLESGDVRLLATSAFGLHFSPSRDRFLETTPGQPLRVRDSATEALLWEASLKEGQVSSAYFFDEDAVLANVTTAQGSESDPPKRESFVCTSGGCEWVVTGQCDPFPGVPALFRCLRRNDPSSSDTLLVWPLEQRSTQLAGLSSRAFVSDDGGTVVWETGAPLSPGLALNWEGTQPSQPLLLPEPYAPTNDGFFLQDPVRFAFFLVRKGVDGARETVLSTWDGQTLQEVMPAGGAEVRLGARLRRAPDAIYATVCQEYGDANDCEVRRLRLP